jgi:MFS family permease
MKILFSRNLNLVWLQNLALLTAYTLVGALLPLIVKGKGYSDTLNGLLLGTGSLGLLVSLLLMGQVIDRSDPRRYIAAGALLWAVTSALQAAWPALDMLAFCRFIQGFAYALFYTASLVYATRSVPDELRGTVVGIIEAVGALAIAGAPFLAFPIAARLGEAVVFWIAAGLSLVTTASVILLASCPPGVVLPGQRQPFQLISRRALFPGLVSACLFAVAIAYVNLAPLIAVRVGAASISLYMGLRAFCTVPTRLLSGAISDRYGPKRVIIPGFAVAILAMLLLPGFQNTDWVYLIPVLFGFGMGISSPALTAWMLTGIPGSQRAVAVNTFTLLTEGSGFFSSWLAGGFLQSGSLGGFQVLAGILAVGLLAFFWSSRFPRVRSGTAR